MGIVVLCAIGAVCYLALIARLVYGLVCGGRCGKLR